MVLDVSLCECWDGLIVALNMSSQCGVQAYCSASSAVQCSLVCVFCSKILSDPSPVPSITLLPLASFCPWYNFVDLEMSLSF